MRKVEISGKRYNSKKELEILRNTLTGHPPMKAYKSGLKRQLFETDTQILLKNNPRCLQAVRNSIFVKKDNLCRE